MSSDKPDLEKDFHSSNRWWQAPKQSTRERLARVEANTYGEEGGGVLAEVHTPGKAN